MSCTRSGCSNRAVLRADLCRAHLLPRLRGEGVFVPGGDTDLAEMAAAVLHLANLAMNSLPDGVVTAGGPYIGIDMYASIEPEASWQVAQLALDVLGSHLIDELPFMGMTLEPPMEFGPDVLLRLRVGVPVSVVDDLRPRLESLLDGVVHEMIGSEARATCVAEPDDSG